MASDFEERFAAQMRQAQTGEGLVGQVTAAHLAKQAEAKVAERPKPSFEEALSADMEAMGVAGFANDITGMERKAFEAVRRRMDVAERLAKAEDCRVEANANFKSKKWLSSMVGYLGGIWFLQRGEPPCPRMVACEAEDYAEVPAALGAGTPGAGDSPLTKEQEKERERLRLSLHLNLAAAALKLSQWVIARTACQYCLMVEGENASPKALYRLAKAYEGEGDLEAAAAAVERLVTKDADNAEAQQLLDSVRAQQANAATSSAALSSMTGADFSKLSQEEQQRMIEEINRGLDEEEGGGDDTEFDAAALAAALSRAGK